MKPVMYLDIDDVLLDWSGPWPRAAPGARDFLLWALRNFEVRWLTYWCPDGRLGWDDARELGKLLGVPSEMLLKIEGLNWQSGAVAPILGVHSKLDGIAWLEHLVLGRPCVWVEDETLIVPLGYDKKLRELGLEQCWRPVNTSRNPHALIRLHRELMQEFGHGEEGAGVRSRAVGG